MYLSFSFIFLLLYYKFCLEKKIFLKLIPKEKEKICYYLLYYSKKNYFPDIHNQYMEKQNE